MYIIIHKKIKSTGLNFGYRCPIVTKFRCVYYFPQRRKIGEKMSEDKKIDRRVVKTKKAIYSAFAQLLLEKDVNAITIKDIADRADINRKTFYNYYAGIYELIEEIENKILYSFEQALMDVNIADALHNPNRLFNELTEIINQDLDFYGHLMRMENNSSLVVKLVGALKTKAKEIISKQTRLAPQMLDIVLDFVVSGMMKVYQNWFNSDRTQSIEDFSKTVSTLTFRGINGIMEETDNM